MVCLLITTRLIRGGQLRKRFSSVQTLEASDLRALAYSGQRFANLFRHSFAYCLEGCWVI
jgi:hypothetical protein